MIKQLTSGEIEENIKVNSKKILLDVRTPEEWEMFGKPDGEKLGLKTFFLTIENENFTQNFINLSISKDFEILTMCKIGQRSQFAAELLGKENYNCINISDGFDGWKRSNLPCL